MPNSVAFSANHSYRSMFLVGQTAIVRLYGCPPQFAVVPSILATAPFGESDMREQSYIVPLPSIMQRWSPTLCLSTLTQCPDSSSDSLQRPSDMSPVQKISMLFSDYQDFSVKSHFQYL